MGFKTNGFPSHGFNPLGFRSTNNIPNKSQALLWADKTVDGLQIDRIGRTTFDAVRPAYVVGNGSTYFEVGSFTDADFPTNYEIEIVFIYSYEATQKGLYGFDPSGVDRNSFATQSIEGVFLNGMGTPNTISTTKVDGDTVNYVMSISPTNVVDYIDGVEKSSKINDSVISNKTLQILNQGELTNASTNSLISFKITNTDTDETILEYNAQTLIKADGTFVDYLEDVSGNGNHAQQMLQPAIPALYDDSIEGNPLNELGHEVADGITQYLDSALTILAETGTYLQGIEGTSKIAAFISDGEGGSELAPLVNRGRVKYNPLIVDGVVDNGEGYSNWDYTFGTATEYITNNNGIYMNIISERPNTRNEVYKVESSTDYLIVINVSLNTISNNFRLNGSAENVFEVNATSIVDANSIGEFRAVRTTKADLTGLTIIDFVHDGINTGEFQINSIAIYPSNIFTNPLTDPLPTSGEFVQGNTWKLDPAYDLAVKADVNDYAYEDTDPTEVVSKLLPCDDHIYGDYLFVSLTKGIVAMYETAQTEPNYTKILKSMGLNELLLDSEGSPLIDSEGSPVYALTATTTREV